MSGEFAEKKRTTLDVNGKSFRFVDGDWEEGV